MNTTTKTTIADRIITEQESKGLVYVGMTSGWLSFRKSSNLYNFLVKKDLLGKSIVVLQGAKKQYRTQGTQLLVFIDNK